MLSSSSTSNGMVFQKECMMKLYCFFYIPPVVSLVEKRLKVIQVAANSSKDVVEGYLPSMFMLNRYVNLYIP